MSTVTFRDSTYRNRDEFPTSSNPELNYGIILGGISSLRVNYLYQSGQGVRRSFLTFNLSPDTDYYIDRLIGQLCAYGQFQSEIAPSFRSANIAWRDGVQGERYYPTWKDGVIPFTLELGKHPLYQYVEGSTTAVETWDNICLCARPQTNSAESPQDPPATSQGQTERWIASFMRPKSDGSGGGAIPDSGLQSQIDCIRFWLNWAIGPCDSFPAPVAKTRAALKQTVVQPEEITIQYKRARKRKTKSQLVLPFITKVVNESCQPYHGPRSYQRRKPGRRLPSIYRSLLLSKN